MTTRRPVRVWRVLAAALCLCPLLLGAESPPPAEQAKRATPVDWGGTTVFVDPATGRLRLSTTEDVARIAASLRQRFSTGGVANATVRPDGMRSVVVGPELIHFATAQIGADGALRVRCVEGADAAARTAFESRVVAGREPADE